MKIPNLIKKLLIYLNGVIIFIFSYIIPKKKNLYIFGGINGKTFSGNSKAMFLYLLKNKQNIEIYYHIRDKKLINYLENHFPILKGKLIYTNSIKAIWNTLKAKYIFTDCDMYDIANTLSYQPGNFNVIDLHHGDPIKSIGYLSRTKYSKHKGGLAKIAYKNYFNNVVKLGCCSSDFFKEIINKAFLTNKFKVTGLPRNDVFFSNDLEIFNIFKKFNLKNYKKIILYAPTRRQDTKDIDPFSTKFLNKLNNWLKEKNYLFLIKAHQNTNPILKSKQYSNIKDISKEYFDIQELLKYIGIMITDYSSIFIDFLLLDKPILFYPYDFEYYQKNLMNLIDKYVNCVIKNGICYNENELFYFLQKDLIADKDYKKNFYKIKNLYHKYQNGGYCNRVLSFIEKNEK